MWTNGGARALAAMLAIAAVATVGLVFTPQSVTTFTTKQLIELPDSVKHPERVPPNLAEMPTHQDEQLLKTAKCITVRGHTDGFGAQASAIVSGMVFGFVNNVSFVHTGFDAGALLGHSDTTPAMEHLDSFLGITANPMAASECVVRHHLWIDTYLRDPRRGIEIRNMLRDKFFSTDKSEFEAVSAAGSVMNHVPNCQPESCDIAVHVRRGDTVVLGRRLPQSYRIITNTEWVSGIENILMDIESKNTNPLAVQNIRFHIFSEGKESDFAEFSTWAAAQAGRGVHIDFTLGGDLRKAFHGFVQADAIAFGQSSFAQLAAIYNGGKHYYWPVQSCLWDPEAMPLGCTENSMSTKVCKGMAAACRAPALMPSASTPA